MVQPAVKEGRAADLNDAELVRRALERDPDAFRQIMQRHNRRLYRIARSVLRNDSEAEDAVQETYIAAFSYLATFRGESSLASWLSRIAMNEALGRLRRKPAAADFAPTDAVRDAEIIQFPSSAASDDPERTTNHGAAANPSACRAGNRCLARSLPRRLHDAGHRGHEHRGNCGPSRYQGGNGQDPVAPRAASHTGADQQADRSAFAGRIPVRWPALRAADRVRHEAAPPQRLVPQ